jgi:hypothetical protein
MRLSLCAAIAVVTALLLALPGTAAASGEDPLIVIAGQAVVPEGEVADGLFVLDADTRIDGVVTGDAIVVSGRTTVAGTVEGDLIVLTGPTRLLPGSEVGGDVVYGDETPEVASGATVAGEIRDEGWNAGWDDFTGALPIIGGIALWIAFTASSLVLGILLIAFAPRAADATFRVAREETGLVVAMGIGSFVALPVIGVAAALTLVGLPLAVAVFLALLPLAAVAYVTAAWALGRRILAGDRDRFVCFLAGLAVLRLVALAPVLGAIAWLAAVVFGLGALVLAAHRTRSGPADYSAPPTAAEAG